MSGIGGANLVTQAYVSLSALSMGTRVRFRFSLRPCLPIPCASVELDRRADCCDGSDLRGPIGKREQPAAVGIDHLNRLRAPAMLPSPQMPR